MLSNNQGHSNCRRNFNATLYEKKKQIPTSEPVVSDDCDKARSAKNEAHKKNLTLPKKDNFSWTLGTATLEFKSQNIGNSSFPKPISDNDIISASKVNQKQFASNSALDAPIHQLMPIISTVIYYLR